MKKLVILGIAALSIASFAKGNGNGYDHGMGSGMGNGKHHRGNAICADGQQRQGRMMMTPEQQKIMNQNSIAMQEVRLEIRKEMSKDSINWNNIEKLNKKVADLQAAQRTQMMKWRVENAANQPVQTPASN